VSRASAAEFRRDVARAHLDTWLVAADDPLDSRPLLRDARTFWWSSIAVRKPVCIGCKARFACEARPGAFLFAAPSVAPTVAGVSVFCTECWRDLPPDDIDRTCTRVLGKLMPGASFNPSDPPWSRGDSACEDIA
jgi:hypothetical protein